MIFLPYLMLILCVSFVLVPCIWKRASIVIATYGYGLTHGYSFSTCNFIMAQFRHESANFSSSLYERANNVSGMRVPKTRPKFGIVGESNGYAVYKSVFASVIDYFYRQKYFRMPKSFPKDSAQLQYFASWNRESGYYTDSLSNYMSGMARWMQTNTAKFFGFQTGGNYTLQDKLILFVWVLSFIGSVYYLSLLVYWLWCKIKGRR